MKAIFETSRPGFSCLSPRAERRTSLIFYVKYTDMESSQFLSTLGRESEDARGRESASFSHSGWRQQVWLQPVCVHAPLADAASWTVPREKVSQQELKIPHPACDCTRSITAYWRTSSFYSV